MWQLLTASFATGLAVGPACFLHCGIFQAVFLARHSRELRRENAALGISLLTGRLIAYLLVGLVVGLLAGTGFVMIKPWVLTAVFGVLMLVYAATRPAEGRRHCPTAIRAGPFTGSAFLFGFATGLSPCPPFLAAGVVALQSHGVVRAIGTFTAFFAGSSVFLVPVLFGTTAISAKWRRHLQRASRLIAAAVAVFAFYSVGMGFHSGPDGHGTRTPHNNGPGPQFAATENGDKRERRNENKDAAGSPRVTMPPRAGPDVTPLFPKQPPKRRFTEALVQRLDLSLREAMFYTPLGDNIVQCNLCPAQCILENGQQGMCRARANIGGKLRSITFARPVSVHIDPIEKKPLFHVIPTTSALSVATVGCNLGCVFCQNFEISQAAPEDLRHYNVPPVKLIEVAEKRGCEGIAYTYTEPTVFYEYMYETAKLAQAKGIRNYWITCGQIREKPLLKLCSVLDAANVDLKGFSDEFYVKYCNAHLAPVLNTLKVLKREGVFVEITNLIIPQANDNPEMIRSMCRWIVQELGAATPVHFSRFHPAYKLTRRPATPLSKLLEARQIAKDSGLKYVYIGNVRAPGVADTVCPQCGKKLIERHGYLTKLKNIKDGTCSSCGTPVPGIWK